MPGVMKRPREEIEDTQCSSTVRISVGSYEHVLYGIDAKVTSSEDRLHATFEPVYLIEAHTGVIKAMATGGRYLASGGADEVVKLYDMRRRKELGSLLSHDGTITAMRFPSPTELSSQPQHLISSDDNNKIIIWRVRDWTPMIQLTTRHGRVNDISIHPSGKIALSVGSDNNVRLWNLVTGKKAAAHSLIVKVPKGEKRQDCEGLKVMWNTSGEQYAILFDKHLRLYDMSAAVKHTFSTESRYHDIQYFVMPDTGRELLAVALENGHIQILDPNSFSLVQELVGHTSRVKCVEFQRLKALDAKHESAVLIAGSTDGMIKLWSTSAAGSWYELGDYNCGSTRITCLAVADANVEHLEEVVKRRMMTEGDHDEAGSETDVKSEQDSDAELLSGVEVKEDDEFTGFD